VSDGANAHVVRWVIAIIAVLALVALLAWARNDPGVGGRFPDPEDVAARIFVSVS
jgi:hypothetical protein